MAVDERRTRLREESREQVVMIADELEPSVEPGRPNGVARRPVAVASMSVVTVRFDPERADIKVTGELDLATAAPLWAVLQSHLAAGRRFLRLDLSGVTFLDATVLSGITRAHQDLLQCRGTLVITGVRALVAKVLRMTGLDEVLFVGGPRGDHDRDHPIDPADLTRSVPR